MPPQSAKPKGQAKSVQSSTASKNLALRSALDNLPPPSVLDDAHHEDTADSYEPPNALDGHTLPFPFETGYRRTKSVVSTAPEKTMSPRHYSGGTYIDDAVAGGTTEQSDIEKAEEKKKRQWRQRSRHYFGNDTRNLFSPTVEFIATFIMILLIVSANLSVSARVERSLDMNRFACRLLTSLENKSEGVFPSVSCDGYDGNPIQANSSVNRSPADSFTIPHSQGIRLLITSLAGGLATMIAVYIAGGLSSAHLNPVVTLAVKIVDNPPGFTVARCILYALVQTAASFLAGVIGIAIHYDAIRHKCSLYENKTGAMPTSDCIGAALYLIPSPGLRWYGCMLSDMVASAVFVLIVMALRDTNNNMRPGANMGGLISGLCVTALGLSMGLNTGGSTNPVRDFGPRLAAAAFGVHNWNDQHYWAIWGPWFVPFVGGTIGAWTYRIVIKPIRIEKAEADKRRKQQEEEDEEEERKTMEKELKHA